MKKKEVLVTVDRGETRVAIRERDLPGPDKRESSSTGRPTGKAGGRGGSSSKDGDNGSGWHVAELYIERPSSRSIVGNIYKGRIDNVVPGLEAAFVEIGMEKNGFLHVDDLATAGDKPSRRGQQRRKIGDSLKRGQEIVVQAIKDPLKTKGPRLTMQLAVPGRYMVYVPGGEGVGVSRRLPDTERQRLRKIAAQLEVERGGAIVRTAARGAKKEELAREVGYLLKLQEVLEERIKSTPAPNTVFQEADLPIRVVRDLHSKEFHRAIIDDTTQYNRVGNFLKRTAPELAEKVELYSKKEPLFEVYGIEDVVRSTLSSRVDLPSGGYLVIDYTEALTVIDVNTGSFTGRRGGSLEDTITKNNLEAAEEVVRQLRLRDIGGIIVIDFIDMERTRNRTQVLQALSRFLDEDRTKTYVMEISPLGLVEMTRENVTDGVREILTEQCQACNGEGVVLSAESMAIEVERRLVRLAADSADEAFLIQLNARVSERLEDEGSALAQLEKATGKLFHFEGSDALPIDTFSLVASGSRAEIEDRALPFKRGEEVMLMIDEPHMYNEHDAIAKIDGYVISVADAVQFVGQKKLVRIDEVTRSAAHATVVAAASAGPPKKKSDGALDRPEPVESLESGGEAGMGGGLRRRARRRGKRRKAA